MKKYVKPELFYEEFELSQQIAGCDFDLVPGTYEDLGCQFVGKDKVWNETIVIFQAGCGTGNSEYVENYCYHNANLSPYGVFNS